MTPADDPVVAALTGPHARFAQTHGRAVRYEPDVAPFAGFLGERDPAAWADLAALLGPGGGVAVLDGEPPDSWTVSRRLAALRMTAREPLVDPGDDRVRRLGRDDDEVFDLVRATDPGPFLPRTPELGAYLGIRLDDRLVALAGERLRPAGGTEVSAVCTHPDFRGRGLAATLVRAVGAAVQARGEQAFLHVMAHNTGAIRLYESLGFAVERPVEFTVVVAPDR